MPERITWAGHATVLIETGGERLVTDPLLRGRLAHIRRRVPLPAPGLLSSPSAVLVSHAHLDHFDLSSLEMLDVEGPVLVPRGWGRLATRAAPAAEVHELGVGDRVSVGAIEVVATDAAHDGRRVPFGRRAPALGFLIEGPTRLYFAGDTDLFGGMADLGPVDVALLPVAGWGKRLPPGHLDPASAAEAASRVRAGIAIPIHWGTYASPGAWLPDPDRPAREFERLISEGGSGASVHILHPGEGLDL